MAHHESDRTLSTASKQSQRETQTHFLPRSVTEQNKASEHSPLSNSRASNVYSDAPLEAHHSHHPQRHTLIHRKESRFSTNKQSPFHFVNRATLFPAHFDNTQPESLSLSDHLP